MGICESEELKKENQTLNNIIKENEAKIAENNEKIKELENNNKLLDTYCYFLQSQIYSLVQQNRLQWSDINNMNFTNNQFFPQCQQMNNNNFYNEPTIKNIIFRINNNKNYSLPVLTNYKLNNIFQLICLKSNINVDLNKIRFRYNSKDITQYFFTNQDVNSLNITSDFAIIDVII